MEFRRATGEKAQTNSHHMFVYSP